MTIHNEDPLTAWEVLKLFGLAMVLAVVGFFGLVAVMIYVG